MGNMGSSGMKIVAILFIAVIGIMGYNYYITVQSTAPVQGIEIIPESQESNAVTILNTGDTELVFSDLSVTVNNKRAFLINPTQTVAPGRIGILRFNTPVFGGNLNVIITGPQNTVSYTVNIEDDGSTFTACFDGLCEIGENCPADVTSCDNQVCYQPTCTNGCELTPIPVNQTDTGCDGICDGAGNCISG